MAGECVFPHGCRPVAERRQAVITSVVRRGQCRGSQRGRSSQPRARRPCCTHAALLQPAAAGCRRSGGASRECPGRAAGAAGTSRRQAARSSPPLASGTALPPPHTQTHTLALCGVLAGWTGSRLLTGRHAQAGTRRLRVGRLPGYLVEARVALRQLHCSGAAAWSWGEQEQAEAPNNTQPSGGWDKKLCTGGWGGAGRGAARGPHSQGCRPHSPERARQRHEWRVVISSRAAGMGLGAGAASARRQWAARLSARRQAPGRSAVGQAGAPARRLGDGQVAVVLAGVNRSLAQLLLNAQQLRGWRAGAGARSG